MSTNLKLSFFKKKFIKDGNLNSSLNKENSLINKVELLDYATLKKIHGFQPDLELHEYKFSNDAILISELQKSMGEIKKIKSTEIKEISKDSENKSPQEENSTNNIDNLVYQKRNNETIMRCLKQFHNFIKYMKFNNVPIDLIEKICPFLMYKYIPKNSYLFKENEKAHYFFSIIKGEIGLRTYNPNLILENKRKYENEEFNMEKVYIFKKNKKILVNDTEIQNTSPDNNNNDDSNENIKNNEIDSQINQLNFESKQINKYYEINYRNIPGITKLLKDGYDTKILKKGDCYGIYNLINNQPYEISGIALEDTSIFYIEKEYFDKYLFSPISRIDLERKYLINKLIPSIPMELIQNIQPEIYDNNDIIYTEFDYAFECFFIYKGSAELKKYSLAKSKSDIYEHKNILKTISKIDEGGIAGLEICKGPNSFYDNTLMITDANTIIYRINILNLKGKKHTVINNIKNFFTKLYEQQKIFLQKVEEKNEEYKENYKISQKREKPKFNYSNFFTSIFKDVNPPIKTKRNKIPLNQFQRLNYENSNNSNKKLKLNPLHNKTLYNFRYKTIDSQKKCKRNLFSLYRQNKEKSKYIVNFKQKSRNEEEKVMPIFNSLDIYNSLYNSSKIKNQKQTITISHDSKYNSFNDNNITTINNTIKSVTGKEKQKPETLSFPTLYKNNSTKTRKNILLKKCNNDKQNKIKSVDKCLYDSGDFQIPFVSLNNINNLKNMKKINNLVHYGQLKKLILDKKFLC